MVLLLPEDCLSIVKLLMKKKIAIFGFDGFNVGIAIDAPDGWPKDTKEGSVQPNQNYDPQPRNQDYAAFAGGMRDLSERFDQSERRAQQAIATVNQSVAAMQDRKRLTPTAGNPWPLDHS